MAGNLKLDVINSKELINNVLHFKKLIVFTIFITTVTTFLFFSLRPTLYESTALVKVGTYTTFNNFYLRQEKVESINDLLNNLNIEFLMDNDLPPGLIYRFKILGPLDLIELTIKSNSKEESLKEIDRILDYIKSRHQRIRENNIERFNKSIEIFNKQLDLYRKKIEQKNTLEFSLAYENHIFNLTQDRSQLEMQLDVYLEEPQETNLIRLINSDNKTKFLFILALGTFLGMFLSLLFIYLKNIFFHNKT